MPYFVFLCTNSERLLELLVDLHIQYKQLVTKKLNNVTFWLGDIGYCILSACTVNLFLFKTNVYPNTLTHFSSQCISYANYAHISVLLLPLHPTGSPVSEKDVLPLSYSFRSAHRPKLTSPEHGQLCSYCSVLTFVPNWTHSGEFELWWTRTLPLHHPSALVHLTCLNTGTQKHTHVTLLPSAAW